MKKLRIYQSPSALSSAVLCEMLYAIVYIRGIKDPEIKWADIESGKIEVCKFGTAPLKGQCTHKQKAASLGGAVHEVGYAWQSRKRVNWHSYPGQILASGKQLIPDPSQVIGCHLEQEIGGIKLQKDPNPNKPKRAMQLDNGRLLVGKLDALLCAPEAHTKVFGQLLGPFGLCRDWVLYDYKSTSDVEKHSKTPTELENDIAACSYALHAMDILGRNSIQCRWVYLQTGKVRASKAVDFVITRRQAKVILSDAAVIAAYLEDLDSDDAEMNVKACSKYAGCLHRKDRGGCCPLLQPLKSDDSERKEEKEEPEYMAAKNKVDDIRKSKLAELKQRAAAANKGKPAKAPEPEPDEDDDDDDDDDDDAIELGTAVAAAEAPKKRGRRTMTEEEKAVAKAARAAKKDGGACGPTSIAANFGLPKTVEAVDERLRGLKAQRDAIDDAIVALALHRTTL